MSEQLWIELHDHLSPDQAISVDANEIVTISVFGSGSSLSMANEAVIGVHETPSEVMAIVRGAQAQ